MILWLISPATSAPSPFLWPTRSTWPPWVYSTSQRTMERWNDGWMSTAGFNKNHKFLKVEELETCLKIGGVANFGKLGDCKSEIATVGIWIWTIGFITQIIIILHCWSNLLSPFPIQPLAYPHRWSEKPPGSMYALAKERSVSAWLIPVYVCFHSFSRTNVGNKYLHLNLHTYFHGSMSEWDLLRIHVKFQGENIYHNLPSCWMLLPRPAHHGSLGISSVPMTQWKRLVNHILAKW